MPHTPIACRRCNRPLKREPYRSKGIGKICEGKVIKDFANDQSDADSDQIIPYDGGDIFIERVACLTQTDEGMQLRKHTCSGVRTNVPRQVYKHSPTGYNFGYGGSGPADWALNSCLLFALRKDDVVPSVYQDFKAKFVAGAVDAERLEISKQSIIDFLHSHNVATKLL